MAEPSKTPEQPAAALAVQAAADHAALRDALVTQQRVLRFMLVAGLVALVLGITWVYVQSYTGRQEVVGTQRLGCARGLLDRADAIAGDLDDAQFRRDAEHARERAGTPEDLRTARKYQRLADRAQDRADSKKQRLLGGRYEVLSQRIPRGSRSAGDPTPAAWREVQMACREAYPAASPWPWVRPHAKRR